MSSPRRYLVTSSRVVASLDSKFLQLRIQRRALYAQAGRSSIRPPDLAFGFAQHTQYMLALGGTKIGICRVGIFEFFLFSALQFSQRNIQRRPARQDDGPLDQVLQLANVSRPFPPRQGVHGLLGDPLDV